MTKAADRGSTNETMKVQLIIKGLSTSHIIFDQWMRYQNVYEILQNHNDRLNSMTSL